MQSLSVVESRTIVHDERVLLRKRFVSRSNKEKEIEVHGKKFALNIFLEN